MVFCGVFFFREMREVKDVISRMCLSLIEPVPCSETNVTHQPHRSYFVAVQDYGNEI